MRTLIGIAAFALMGTGCAKVGFEPSKEAALSKSSVFAGNVDGQLNPPGSVDGEIHQPPYLGVPGQTQQLIDRMCSARLSEDSTNFLRAKALGLPVQFLVNGKICSTKIAAIGTLLLQKTVSIADLTALCPSVVPSEGPIELSLAVNDSTYKPEKQSPREFQFLYASQDVKMFKPMPEEVDEANCTSKASPLVIHLKSAAAAPSYVELSSIKDGVQFDLLGSNNAHHSVRIGWFKNTEFAFLTLPNSAGQVNGIDELFGNNTRGPDGLFTENGYAALAKYDGTTADGRFHVAAADGRIDRRDPVYSRLRLWKDKNLDGIAQPNELISLSDAGIASIDLDYSEQYQETDRYGNQTMMKSVVSYDNGALDLIFDLWFRYELN